MTTATPEYWRARQAIVTGGAGFVGGHVVAQLRKLGCSSIFVPSRAAHDLRTEAGVLRMFADAAAIRPAGAPFVVFHIAGRNGGIGANKAYPAEFYYENAAMNLMVLHHAWAHGAQAAIAAGAGNSYPLDAPTPLREASLWSGYPQAESAGYALAKRMLTVQSQTYWAQHQFPIHVALLGNVYGPGDNFDPATAPVASAQVRRIVDAQESGSPSISPWGTGAATRDFVYVRDVALGLLLAVERCAKPALFNLSSGQETSVRRLVETICDIVGYAGAVHWDSSKPDGARARCLDMTHTLALLNWMPNTPLELGLRETVAWYRAHRTHPSSSS